MKNLILKNLGGRFGNQLYFILHAYVLSKNKNNTYKYIINNAAKVFKLSKYFYNLNLQEYFSEIENKEYESEIEDTGEYLQIFDKDFKLEDLNEFINKTILRSNYFLNIKNNFIFDINTTMCINIRNGDYLTLPQFNCFDRFNYLNDCLNYINVKDSPHKYKNVVVISDDNSINIKYYNDLLHKKFKTVIYIHNNNLLEELCLIGLFKCKILWNSTFSYWGGFIGNAYYKDNYHITFAPSAFDWSDSCSQHCNPNWAIINTPINNR